MPKVFVQDNPESEKRQPVNAAAARPAARNGAHRPLPSGSDFYGSPSAAGLASAQGVEPVRRAGIPVRSTILTQKKPNGSCAKSGVGAVKTGRGRRSV